MRRYKEEESLAPPNTGEKKDKIMGTTTVRTYIRLKKDAWLLPSHETPTSVEEFEEMAKFFPAGTLFHEEPNTDEPDCEIHTPCGWCYSLPDKRPDVAFTGPCNFHKHILGHWQDFPHLFEEY